MDLIVPSTNVIADTLGGGKIKIRLKAGNSQVRTQLKNGFFIFLYRNVALYYQDFGRSEVFVTARVFNVRFAGGLAFVP